MARPDGPAEGVDLVGVSSVNQVHRSGHIHSVAPAGEAPGNTARLITHDHATAPPVARGGGVGLEQMFAVGVHGSYLSETLRHSTGKMSYVSSHSEGAPLPLHPGKGKG